MSARVIHGDCIEVMAAMPEASVGAICTDPPYLLSFMGRAWDHAPSPAEAQAMHGAWAREALRVLKPGGHLLAFGGTRTYHRLACAIEDAGFEIRDTIAWLYGSGFPKSLDVSKAIDRAAGAERKVVGESPFASRKVNGTWTGDTYGDEPAHGKGPSLTAPATPEAERWSGWGTALKPAHEPIVVARKPLSGTVAACVLAHGTGALNVDGCRIGAAEGDYAHPGNDNRAHTTTAYDYHEAEGRQAPPHAAGRWPANVVLDEQAAECLDAMTGTLTSPRPYEREALRGRNLYDGGIADGDAALNYGDSGGASRFFPTFDHRHEDMERRAFYCAKSSTAERNAGLDGFEEKRKPTWSSGEANPGTFQSESTAREARNVHPTVKPIALMRWLVRLVTPPGGTVLDPFAGSGTTGIGAGLEGFDFIGIEREAEYVAIAQARCAWWARHPDGMTLVKRVEAEKERAMVKGSGQAALFEVA
jgi:site-specific DNA-methyltransferase (adenine-specific)